MAKALVIHPERCTACRACELACSRKHHGAFNPSRSRIQAIVFLEDALYIPTACAQCDVGPGVSAEAGILHNIIRTRHAFTCALISSSRGRSLGAASSATTG